MFTHFRITELVAIALFVAAGLARAADKASVPPEKMLEALTGQARPIGKREAVVRLPDRAVKMVHDWDRDLWITSSCVKPDGGMSCMAAEALGRVRFSKKDDREWPQLTEYGAELGAYLCEGPLGAEYVSGSVEREAYVSLCRFKDGSIVNSGALAAAARDSGAVPLRKKSRKR